MRTGCRNFVLRIGALVASSLLIVVGVLLLIFGLSTSTPVSNLRVILVTVAAAVAVYAFLRIGREIWNDLRARPPEENQGSDDTDVTEKEERTPDSG